MSNIERKYAYYDEGVLPDEGEYGITYLTLYSSGSGNIYDGWIYDPENKIPVSSIERTFGFRHPEYSQYCWDDEVVVDLSNAQNREESSEFEQGRITSFNTNVSSRPIILEDVDITGLTETEREAKATTILFSAIPLINDAYIHAEVEVGMKMNLSDDNTTGNIRVEAFYILNDESDRTMRPHPINHYNVTRKDEWNILRLLYWNPALKHEVSNYIGVKLIVTGGTAEIGISDDPEYGDAIITLTSAGLTGDKIDPGKPLYLEMFGLEEVPMNYHFRPSDYTVLCTYDTGEIYDVTSLCQFSMEIGEKFVEPVTLLQATYCGLHASMNVRLGMIDHIELLGLSTFYDEYTLDISDFTVLAYLDSGDIYDITTECEFSPAMGTTINNDIVLTATYVDDHSTTVQTFTDSMNIEAIPVIMVRTGEFGDIGLIYTLYNDYCVRITGNANIPKTGHPDQYKEGEAYHEVIDIPDDIVAECLQAQDGVVLRWDAEGEIGGIILDHSSYVRTMSNFDNVVVKPYRVNKSVGSTENIRFNPIVVDVSENDMITPYMLSFLSNIEYDPGELKDVPITFNRTKSVLSIYGGDLNYAFYNCASLWNLNFTKNWDVSNVYRVEGLCKGCTSLRDITGLKGWRLSPNCHSLAEMLYGCTALESVKDLSLWDVSYVDNITNICMHSGIKNLVGIGGWKDLGENSDAATVNVQGAFQYTQIDDLIGLHDDFFSPKMTDATGLFANNSKLKNLNHAASSGIFDTSNVQIATQMFYNCPILEDISGIADIDVSNVITMQSMFASCPNIDNIEYVTRWEPNNCEHFQGMFAGLPAHDTGGGIVWPDANLTINTLFSMDTSISPSRIRINKLDRNQYVQYGLPDPEGTYFYTSGGMFSGSDLMDVVWEDLGAQGSRTISVRFVYIESVPWWYRTILNTDMMERTDLRRYN